MKKLLFSAALVLASLPAFAQSAAGEKYDPIRICVIEDDMLKEILGFYDQNTGTTYVDRDGNLVELKEAFPLENGYSATRTWYVNNDKIKCLDRTYVKYGLPRILETSEVKKVGMYDKVGLYAETGSPESPEVIYIPVQPGCEFQPYQAVEEEIKIEESKQAPKKAPRK
jgi:hypothetical protein